MPIALHVITMNGAISEYHVLKRLEVDFTKDVVMSTVLSYTNETAFLAGGTPVQSLPVMINMEACQYPLEDSIHNFLITDSTSPYKGGVVVADQSNTLEAAKERAWNSIKAVRAQREVGDFTFNGGVYQCDTGRITGATTMALLAKMAGQPFSIDWTLTDNTVQTLTADQMIAMGAEAGKYVDSVFATARSLRTDIEAATTIAEVEAIKWPEVETANG